MAIRFYLLISFILVSVACRTTISTFQTTDKDKIGVKANKFSGTIFKLSYLQGKLFISDTVILKRFTPDKSEEVILSFTPLQGRYIKALHLHRSQEIIKETKDEVLIRLTVIPNFELMQKILMMGDSIKVLQPEWLKNKIITDLKNNLKKYGKYIE